MAYNEDQPRVPSGPGGGQWTSEGSPNGGGKEPKRKEGEQHELWKTVRPGSGEVLVHKESMPRILSGEHFSVVSAGPNPNDPREKRMSPFDPFFAIRYEKLRDELERNGFAFTPVLGKYGGAEEPSFVVFHDGEPPEHTDRSAMVLHNNSHEARRSVALLNKIGKKFNQDSVLHSGGGRNTIRFVNGKKAGKECGGSGWKDSSGQRDFFTKADTTGRSHSKFTLDISECFEKGML